MSVTSIQAEIDRLKAELKTAQIAEEAQRRASHEGFALQYQFTITLEPHPFATMWDDTIKVYRLAGKVLNAAEYRALGGSPFEGSMSYYYNTSTHRLMCPIGGGSLFFAGSWGPQSARDITIILALGKFLAEYPEGGDVTSIIDYHPRRA